MAETRPMADTPLPPDAHPLASTSDYLAERLGLHFPPERWPELQRVLSGARRQEGSTAGDGCGLPYPALGEEQLETLASELTIGETYFFREPAAFAALRDTLLPELIRDRRERGQRLRFWSAGCASGEEAYTLAFEIARALPDLARWNVCVLATDINPHFLAKARRGIFDEWSFRDTVAEFRAECFSRDEQGKYVITPRLKALTRFARLNLMDDTYPAMDTCTTAMDVIFCRNVLMYFRPDRARMVLERLSRCLVDGGWLVLSPVETPLVTLPELVPQRLPGTLLFRKTALAPLRAPCDGNSAPDGAPDHLQPRPAATTARRAPAPTNAPAMALLARRAADQGRLDEALDWCRRALSADALSPAWNYLRATILLERGETEAAATALQRTLYLDPGCVMAHVALAGLAARQGKPAQVRRHFSHALDLLANYPPEQALPEGDGISAGQLREIIASRSAPP